jgi:hypothetical protein
VGKSRCALPVVPLGVPVVGEKGLVDGDARAGLGIPAVVRVEE